jgi:hypothetical protein
MNVLELFDAGGLGEIDHQQRGVRALQRRLQPRHRMLRGDRRQVDELEVDVLVRHHPRLGKLRGERVRRVARRGGQPRRAAATCLPGG